MPAKRNGLIPNGHFRKDWQRFITTNFDQPLAKKRRRARRARRAAAIAPRPAQRLRPAVRAPTVRHNRKLRLGRGFTLEELRAAGIGRRLAPTIGIAVDHRRQNLSLESRQRNVARLKTYRARLVLFPLDRKRPRRGDASADELKLATQLAARVILPLRRASARTERARVPSDEERAFAASHALRSARSKARLVGVRAKKAKEAAESLEGPKTKGKE